MSNKIKMFLALFLICFVGIIASTVMIDKQIDSYIAEMKTNIDINIEIIDNTNSNVTIEQKDNDVKVYINPNNSDEIETDKVNEEYVVIVAKSGLNIRQEPSIESEKVGIINYGEKVKILEDHGEWYKTENGFIYKDYTIKI